MMNINDVIVRMCFWFGGFVVMCLFGAICTRVPQNNTLSSILLISALVIVIIGAVAVKVFEWIAKFGRDNQ